MESNKLYQNIRSGRFIYGTAIASTSPIWPGAVKQSGIDFVFIDTEHIPIDRTRLSMMCQTYQAFGLPPIVRIPSPDPLKACKVLDGGASGILAPYIESPEQVLALVGATKLRPLKGKRLDRALSKREDLEPDLKAYLEKRNQSNILMANIESRPALENLDAILDVPGLDGIIIGPHDLSCSLGYPEQYNHPEFEKAVLEIIKKARGKGLGVGIHFSGSPSIQIKWAREGVNIILHSSDIAMFSQTLKHDIKEIKEALEDERQSLVHGEDQVI